MNDYLNSNRPKEAIVLRLHISTGSYLTVLIISFTWVKSFFFFTGFKIVLWFCCHVIIARLLLKLTLSMIIWPGISPDFNSIFNYKIIWRRFFLTSWILNWIHAINVLLGSEHFTGFLGFATSSCWCPQNSLKIFTGETFLFFLNDGFISLALG